MASFVLYPTDGPSLLCPLNPEQSISIGRHPDNQLTLVSESASSHHAILAFRNGAWFVQDLSSSNGTRVNGAPIEEAQIADGDRVHFGDVQAIFYENDEEAQNATSITEFVDTPIMLPDASRSTATRPAPPPRKSIPPPAKSKLLPAERLNKTMRAYPGQDTAGCTTAMMVIGLFALALLLGLMFRHQSETGRNFVSDAVSSVFGKVPKITIEKTEP